MTNSTHIVEFSVQATPAQILSQAIPHIQRHGIELFELVRISDQLKALTQNGIDGRAIINMLAAYDVSLHLIGNRFMPFATGEQPSIIVPANFSDTTMQFHSHVERVRGGDRFCVYFPTLDSESGITEMLVKQGVWLKNYNANYLYALLQKFRATKQMLIESGDFSGRTTLWIPMVRIDFMEGPFKMSLLHSRASLLRDLESPFARLAAKSNSSHEFVEPVSCTAERLAHCREAVRQASPWYGATLDFFDPANNPINPDQAKTVRELLIAAETAVPHQVRTLLTLPNRNLQ